MSKNILKIKADDVNNTIIKITMLTPDQKKELNFSFFLFQNTS